MASFAEQGFPEIDALHHHAGIKLLYDAIRASRHFDSSLFLTEEEWEQSTKSHTHTNPRRGNNLLESFKDQLAFLEQHPAICNAAGELLGEDYTYAFNKVVCRLPRSMLPDWVQHLVGDLPANTLNAFIKPQYRDVSYYLESDLHQDIQDYPRLPKDRRDWRMMIMYVHLTDVTQQDGPLYVLPGSHRLGATPYQHDIKHLSTGQWQYTRPKGESITVEMKPILGPAGHVTFWHSCLVHGTRPVKTPRFVLRYMLNRGSAPHCGLDEVNANISWPLYPKEDYSAGANALTSGKWSLHHTDFTRWNP